MDDNGRRRGRDPALPRLLGDCLCLDFANTVEDRTGAQPVDMLPDYAALARWGWHVGDLSVDERDRLLARAAELPAEATATLAKAIELREAIYRVFAAIAHDQTPRRADLARIEAAHRAALGHARLTPDGAQYDWTWNDATALERMLWPVARSAVALLTSDGLPRVKQCPGTGDCGWLFLDLSRNATRRWCSMEGCGSRAKMRRLYARRKRGSA
jgi:predicted RNA-binding Zn ribbon-like protein